MSQALATSPAQRPVPAVPWRDPHTVSPAELSRHIQRLEQACLDNPRSADLRTCLGMAYAVNYEVYKSIGAPNSDAAGYSEKVLFTGYYTPIFEASTVRTGAFQYPLYRRPADLLTDPEGLTKTP